MKPNHTPSGLLLSLVLAGIFLFGKLATALPTDAHAEAKSSEVDLSVSKTLLSGGVVEDAFQYRITVTNNGPDTAKNVMVADAVPEDMSAYVTHTIANVPGGCEVSEGKVMCSFIDLPANTSAVVDVNVYEISGETRETTSIAAVSSENVDTNLENNTASSTVTVIVK